MNLDDDFFEYSDETAEEDFVSQDFTADDFIFPEGEPKETDPNRRRNIFITAGVSLVVLFCCCITLWVAWNTGDYVVEFLGY